MSPRRFLTPLRRDALLALLALGLLATPLWAPTDDLGDETHTYERAEIVIDDQYGISFAEDRKRVRIGEISDAIACAPVTYRQPRVCAFERLLVGNETVPTERYTPGNSTPMWSEQYHYVQLNGSVYETEYVVNESATAHGGLHRIELALDPVSAPDVLERISIDAAAEYPSLSDTAVEVARDGQVTVHSEVDVPQTPVRLDDGSYYRVHEATSDGPDPVKQLLDILLKAFGVVAGLYLLYRLTRRFEVTYVGGER
ncbi:hypothetical protein SAMN06269185_1817 [Natronoarchaeum philippinense]|uniref:Uncharacterized protein n=1 Tax=Natronoarchaeum philippinense TaxID=558529 RepID=A0A285NY62_NATPI|nr:hypothetical protein [Natronoarchaeum philippinense]SNZ12581.1 hypothetical protein SAMN06269185_1817 [Natronoarchaeum philippinense]